MMALEHGAILARAKRLVIFLQSIAGEEQARAQEAAAIVQHRIDAAESKLDASTVDALEYGMGPRGIHDWAWSDETRKTIEEITYDR